MIRNYKIASMKSICLLMLTAAFGLFVAVSCGSAKMKSASETALNGTWELNFITGEDFAFDELYPQKKPTLSFDLRNKKVSGNTGCNSFNGPVTIEGNKISFKLPMAMTRMMCEGAGETTFLETLASVNTYAITENNTLALMKDDIAVMRFSAK